MRTGAEFCRPGLSGERCIGSGRVDTTEWIESSPPLRFHQCGLWIALGELDAASVPPKVGSGSDDRESFVEVGFCGVSGSWMTLLDDGSSS
jgi:hypothetical protein